MLALWERQEVLAHNLANVSSPGFKREDVFRVAGAPELVGWGLTPAAGRPLWLAVPVGPPGVVPWTDFSPGPLVETGRALDVALTGPGFLVVETPEGPRYTRNGSLTVEPDGALGVSGGGRVLGWRGPILVGGGRVRIGETGQVEVDGRPVDTLQVVDFPRPYALVKVGHGRFAPARPDVEPAPARDVGVRSGFLEQANVNPVETMVAMIELFRTFEAYQRAIQAADEADRQAVEEVGRVA